MRKTQVKNPTYDKERAILHISFLPLDMLQHLGKTINKEQNLYELDDLIEIHNHYVQAVKDHRDERVKKQ